jgi:hypothetical protein
MGEFDGRDHGPRGLRSFSEIYFKPIDAVNRSDVRRHVGLGFWFSMQCVELSRIRLTLSKRVNERVIIVRIKLRRREITSLLECFA